MAGVLEQTRPALPEVGLDAVTGRMLEKQEEEAALWCQMTFSTLFRPCETTRMTVGDLMDQGRTAQHWGIILSPFDGSAKAKNLGFDETILLNDIRAPWLGPALGHHRDLRIQELKEDGYSMSELLEQPMFTVTEKEVLDSFRGSAEELGILHLCESLYALRHGGLTRDALPQLRTRDQLARRGRLGSKAAILHYEEIGRNQGLTKKMPGKTVEMGKEWGRNRTGPTSAFALRFHNG